MKTIIIELLSDEDRLGIAYQTAKKVLNNVIRCQAKEDIFNALNSINTNNEDLLLTILSHGTFTSESRNKTVGISFDTHPFFLITWEEIIEQVNHAKTYHRLTLNLLAVCKSDSILKAYNNVPNAIDEILVTTTSVCSITKALLCNKEGYEEFHYNLEDEEKDIYAQLTK